MANPIKFSDIFDFTNDNEVQLAVKIIKEVNKEYQNLISTGKKLASQYAQNHKEIALAISQVSKSLQALRESL